MAEESFMVKKNTWVQSKRLLSILWKILDRIAEYKWASGAMMQKAEFLLLLQIIAKENSFVLSLHRQKLPISNTPFFMNNLISTMVSTWNTK